MGINGLFTFLKQYTIKSKPNAYIGGKRIGIDIFWFMHKCVGNYDKLHELLSDFVASSSRALFVFDGRVSEERKAELAELRMKRLNTEEIIKKIQAIPRDTMTDSERQFLDRHLADLKVQAWAPRGDFIESVKKKIADWWGDKAEIIVAPYEADLYFKELESSGRIDCILSNDSDMLALGYKNIIRPEIDGSGFVKIYELDMILKGLNMNCEEWLEFMNLCREYKGNDILIPYSVWRVYCRKRIA